MSKIAVYTFIGHNSAKYAHKLWFYSTLLNSNNNINYYCFRTINNSQYKEEPLPKYWGHIADIQGHPYSNSMCHAYCLNAAIAHAYKSDSDYIIFCDADVAILYRNWDFEIIYTLNAYDVFSFENKYGYPGVAFFAFKKSLLNEIFIDFKPLLKQNSESCQRMMLDSKTVKCDTGFKMMEMAHYGLINCYNLKLNKGTQKLPYKDEGHKALCLSKPTHMQEYLLNGELFGTHLQASRSDGASSDYGKAWLWRVDQYFETKYGLRK